MEIIRKRVFSDIVRCIRKERISRYECENLDDLKEFIKRIEEEFAHGHLSSVRLESYDHLHFDLITLEDIDEGVKEKVTYEWTLEEPLNLTLLK